MEINLVQSPVESLNIVYLAARNCYSAEGPISVYSKINNIDTKKKEDLVHKVLGSGHTSLLENISYTFAIEGVSRSLLAQLTRHRAGVAFAVQSQRYVEIKESIIELMELAASGDEEKIKNKCDKYFIEFKGREDTKLIRSLIEYRKAIANGCEPEDARMYLPNCTKTNIVMTVNARELSHICNLRLCTRSQLEIRQLIKEMKNLVINNDKWLEPYLVPNCVKNKGICFEGKTCGRYPTIDKVIERWGREYLGGRDEQV